MKGGMQKKNIVVNKLKIVTNVCFIKMSKKKKKKKREEKNKYF